MPSAKPTRTHALQNIELANEIARAERTILSVLANPDLLLELAPFGYNEATLNEGLALVRNAQIKCGARQKALAQSSQAKVIRDQILFSVQDEFSAYRQTVQANYHETDRNNLGGSGKVPFDTEKFLAYVRSAYMAAQETPYLEVLSNFTFTRERLLAALKTVDELASADRAYRNAAKVAQAATSARDIAGDVLQTWLIKFRKQTRPVFRNHAEVHAQPANEQQS